MQHIDRFTIVTLLASLTCVGEALAGGTAPPQPNAKADRHDERLPSASRAKQAQRREHAGRHRRRGQLVRSLAQQPGRPSVCRTSSISEESVADGPHRGFTLRLVNRTAKP